MPEKQNLLQKLKSYFRLSILAAFGLGAALSLLILKFHGIDSPKEVSENAERPVPISAYTVVGKDIVNKFETHGYLRPSKEVVLRPSTGSTVRDVLVSVGEKVVKGQILAHLDSDYQQLRSKLDRIDQQTRNLDYGVTMALAKKQFLSANEVRQKQLEHEAAQIRTQLNDLENNSVIKAPIDGVVGEVSMSSGDFVDGQANYSIRIVDTSALKIQLYAPQSVALHLVKGAVAELIRRQYDEQGHESDQKAAATLDAIAPIVDPKTGSVQIDLTAAETPNNWVAGIFVQVQIVTEEAKNVVSVPNSSIVFDNGKPFVFKVVATDLREPASESVAMRVEKIPVTVGIRDSAMTEVKQGLSEFDQIVSEGQGRLADGTIVEIVE